MGEDYTKYFNERLLDRWSHFIMNIESWNKNDLFNSLLLRLFYFIVNKGNNLDFINNLYYGLIQSIFNIQRHLKNKWRLIAFFNHF